MSITIYIAMSANRRISNSKGVPDWLSPEYSSGFYEICQKTKTVIMGRKTYSILAPDYLPLKEDGITVVLTTNREAQSDNRTVVFTDEGAREIIAMLRAKGTQRSCDCWWCIRDDQIHRGKSRQRNFLVVEPALFGKGLSMFNEIEFTHNLTLIKVTQLNANTVKLHYEVRYE